MKRYERGELQQLEWLDGLAFRSIEQLRCEVPLLILAPLFQSHGKRCWIRSPAGTRRSMALLPLGAVVSFQPGPVPIMHVSFRCGRRQEAC